MSKQLQIDDSHSLSNFTKRQMTAWCKYKSMILRYDVLATHVDTANPDVVLVRLS